MAKNPYYEGPSNDHYDGTQFFNPGAPTDKSFTDVLRWRLTSRFARWPKSVEVEPTKPDASVVDCRVTMIGYATTLIQTDGLNILTDPVWSDRASPLSFAGPIRVTAPGVRFDDLPPIDLIFLSHSHYDHLDLKTLARLQVCDKPRLITPLGNDTIVRRAIPDINVVAGDWGDRIAVSESAVVTIVPALHWSARGMRDRRMALWSGFMLRTPRSLIYFAGDTGYGDGSIFRQMFADHGRPDLALLPIGAYAPRWFMAPQHANPEESVRIMLDLGAKQAIAIHWGCFQLTDEPREEPMQQLRHALSKHGISPNRFRTLEAGEAFTFATQMGNVD